MGFLEAVDRIIFECVDATFSRYRFIRKEGFYQLLESSYGINPEHLSSNYDAFHQALKKQLGSNCFKVERKILRILKERTKEGIYNHTDEIEAFNIITNAIIKDTNRELQEIKKFHSNRNGLIKALKNKLAEQDDKLKNAERMAAIGETASMVGHDIRNPLQSVTGELYLISHEVNNMPDGESKQAIQESLEIIEENLIYINKIIVDLQDYARPLIPEMANVNIAGLLNSTLQTINIPANIKLNVETNSDLTLKTDAAFIRRAVTNLVNNAIQAMPSGGGLTLITFKTDKRVTLSILDTGEGIPEEVKGKMFRPLVTTKSKGQGLGLAVVKRLIDALDGNISFESEKGKGTKFTIELPVNA